MRPASHDLQTSIREATVTLVRQVLNQRRWRPARLAEEFGVHPDLVRRWVRGERRPQLDHLLMLAQMADISLDELFGLKEAGGAAEDSLQHLSDIIAGRVVQHMMTALASDDPVAEVAQRALRQAGAGPLAHEARIELSEKATEALERLIALDEARARRRRQRFA